MFTTSGDMHASAVATKLADTGFGLRIVFTDRLAERHRVGFRPESGFWFTDLDGRRTTLEECGAIWWRRIELPGAPLGGGGADEFALFVRSEWDAVLHGHELVDPALRWVSNPTATRIYSNKLIQLRIAHEMGIPIPRTVISNDMDMVEAELAGREFIIKPAARSIDTTLYVKKISASDLVAEQMVVAPATYQEFVGGRHHLRVHVFGDAVICFEIDCEEVDWRRTTGNMKHVVMGDQFDQLCRAFIRRCGLRMGIMDFKLSDDGPVFLENNPQGQFLFVEAITGYPLTAAFAEFLGQEEAVGERGDRTAPQPAVQYAGSAGG